MICRNGENLAVPWGAPNDGAEGCNSGYSLEQITELVFLVMTPEARPSQLSGRPVRSRRRPLPVFLKAG